MKKLIKIIFPLIFVITMITACASEKTKVYTNEPVKDQKNEITLTYKGDTVNRIQTISNLNFLTSNHSEELNTIKKSIEEQNSSIDGLSYKVEEKDNKMVITWNLDFSKVNFDKDKEKLGFKSSSLEKERKLSYVEENLKKIGSKEKTN